VDASNAIHTLTLSQLFSLGLMMVIGLVVLIQGKASPALQGNTFAGSSTSPGNYALALFSGLFAFSGTFEHHLGSG
jgi:hypothetical protein